MVLWLFKLIDRWLHRRTLPELTPWQRAIVLAVKR